MKLLIFCECSFENGLLLNFQGSLSELVSFVTKAKNDNTYT